MIWRYELQSQSIELKLGPSETCTEQTFRTDSFQNEVSDEKLLFYVNVRLVFFRGITPRPVVLRFPYAHANVCTYFSFR